MPHSYQQLTREERYQISILNKRGDNPAQIARQLKRDRSTITRELQRNKNNEEYNAEIAHIQAQQRRWRKAKKLTSTLLSIVQEKLAKQWSPQQISGRLKKEGIFISHETIYKYIWEDKKCKGILYKELRHSGKKYNRRSKGSAGRGCIPNRIDIDQRPAIVEEKTRFGDLEIDTIIGANHKGVIISIVDRHTKFTWLIKAEDKNAGSIRDKVIKTLLPFKNWIYTITSDNGKEFAYHEEISKELDITFFFAKPYHSWERGLNEHTNGLVRQYAPKGTTFEQTDVDGIQILLNNRPRKSTDFATPQEAIQRWIGLAE